MEDSELLREKYRGNGLLLDHPDTKSGLKSFSILGVKGVLSYGWAATGAWDDLTAAGSVHTNLFSLRRVYMLPSDEGADLLVGTQLLLGPLNLAIGFS